MIRRVVLTCALCAIALSITGGQATAQDARLTRRLDAATAGAANTLVDSARRNGLPTEPLVQKALEGASKGASSAVILDAMHALAVRLSETRAAVGNAEEAELVAGAVALDAGAAPGDLQRIRASAGAANVASAFVGLAFLLQRGVSSEGATAIVTSMLQAKLEGADFTTLQRLVEQDIRAGASATEAARVRSRALITHGSKLWPRVPGEGA